MVLTLEVEAEEVVEEEDALKEAHSSVICLPGIVPTIIRV
jgi:hypothetical protein